MSAGKPFGHYVLFELKDDSAEARQALVDACHTYLSGHPGEVSFSTGLIAHDVHRDVSVTDYSVALHIVFENKAAQDLYQAAPRHHAFIAEQGANWASVRVMDTYVTLAG